jgi:hypothetical protein
MNRKQAKSQSSSTYSVVWEQYRWHFEKSTPSRPAFFKSADWGFLVVRAPFVGLQVMIVGFLFVYFIMLFHLSMLQNDQREVIRLLLWMEIWESSQNLFHDRIPGTEIRTQNIIDTAFRSTISGRPFIYPCWWFSWYLHCKECWWNNSLRYFKTVSSYML